MKRTVRILRRAQRDLQEIHDLVVREAPLRADRFVNELIDRIESLAVHAERGPSPRDPTLRDRGFRFLVHAEYLVFYKVAGRQVRIYRVLHGRRAFRGLL